MPRRRLTVLLAADGDVRRLGEDDPRLELRALGLISLIADGRVRGDDLQHLPLYGDLSDCRKVYFGALGDGRPTHRLVYQVVGVDDDGVEAVEVVEVVAVEAREDGYAYLLAALRLGRLPDDTRPEAKRVDQNVKARRGAARKERKERPRHTD